jgi:hypothetical protein
MAESEGIKKERSSEQTGITTRPWRGLDKQPEGSVPGRSWLGRHWRKLLLVAIVLALLLAYDRLNYWYWVGSTELELEVVVTDAGTGQPISGARIEVLEQKRLIDDPDKDKFILTTDDNGRAHQDCGRVMCCGQCSGLLLTNTYCVYREYLPLQVTAPGYEPSQWYNSGEDECWRRLRRDGPERNKLTLPVSLQKR